MTIKFIGFLTNAIAFAIAISVNKWLAAFNAFIAGVCLGALIQQVDMEPGE